MAAFAMFTQLPGSIVPDTKYDLYVDPLFLMNRVVYGWDPGTYLGFIPHQAMSYLFPMGSYFYVMQLIGIPVWISQRLWQTLLLFIAGSGVVALMDTLKGKPRSISHWIAAVFYMFNPYVIMWLPRTSGMLLPYVFLPWLLNYFVKGMWRPRGWKYPLLVSLMFFMMTGLNAASTLFVLVAPLLYFIYHVYVLRTSRFRTALKFALKTALVSVLLSIWWIVPLLLQGKLALNVLTFTESSYITNLTSSFSESVRLFGFWFFYGGDKWGAWFRGSLQYLENPLLVVTTFTVPVLALGALWVIRWRYRIYFGMLMVSSVLLMVGSFPPSAPSPYGRFLNFMYDRWAPAMAFRNTYKAAPMLALAFGVLLAVGAETISRRLRENREITGEKPSWTTWIPAVLIFALIAVNTYGFWTFSAWDREISVPNGIPEYWKEAAKQVDAFNLTEEQKRRTPSPGTSPNAQSYRLIMLPGQAFAYYQWGTTLDDINQSLIKRPTLLRTLVPYGSPYGANFTAALDGAVQQEVLEPNTLVPVAKYLGAGDVLVRNDLNWARWDTPRPAVVTQMLSRQGLVPGPGGGRYGERGQWLKDRSPEELRESDFGFPETESNLAPVEYFVILDPKPIVRTDVVERPLLISGDNFALMPLAAFGYLDSTPPFFLSASQSESQLEETLRDRADIVVTDQNRRRAWQFGIIKNNFSYTLAEGERIDRNGVIDRNWQVFDEVDAPGKQTVSVLRGNVESIRASSYGSYWYDLPENRPTMVMDRNLDTAWTVGGLGSPVGAQIEITMKERMPISQVTITLDYVEGSRNVGRVVAIDDSGKEVPLDLEQTADPQTFSIPETVTKSIRFRIDRVAGEDLYLPPVGIAEIEIPGVRAEELLRTPYDLFARAPGGNEGIFASNNLSYVFQRSKNPVGDFLRSDEEANLARIFRVPGSREFSTRTGISLTPLAPDTTIDRLLGISGPVVKAESSSRWLGYPIYRGLSAVDNDPESHWSPAIHSKMVGEYLDIEYESPQTFSEFNFNFLESAGHSGIAKATLFFDNGASRTFEFEPPPAGKTTPNQIYNRKVDPPVTSKKVRFQIDEIRKVYTVDSEATNPNPQAVLMPTAVAELGAGPTNTVPNENDNFATECPATLPAPTAADIEREGPQVIPEAAVWVDGQQVQYSLRGKIEHFLNMFPIDGEPCGAGTITLDRGEHTLYTSPKGSLKVDRVALESNVAGAPNPSPALPRVEVTAANRASWDLTITGGSNEPFYLIMGENINPAWRATVTKSDGSTIDLGEPRLINGYANAWKITQSPGGQYKVRIHYRPQQLVFAGLFVSFITLVIVLLFLVQIKNAEASRRRVRPAQAGGRPGGGGPPRRGGPPPGRRGGPPPGATPRRRPPPGVAPPGAAS